MHRACSAVAEFLALLLFVPLRGTRRASLRYLERALSLQITSSHHWQVIAIEYVAECFDELVHAQHVRLCGRNKRIAIVRVASAPGYGCTSLTDTDAQV